MNELNESPMIYIQTIGMYIVEAATLMLLSAFYPVLYLAYVVTIRAFELSVILHDKHKIKQIDHKFEHLQQFKRAL